MEAGGELGQGGIYAVGADGEESGVGGANRGQWCCGIYSVLFVDLLHGFKDMMLPGEGPLRGFDGGEALWGADHASEEGRFWHGELGCGFSEIVVGCGLDAEAPMAPVDEVKVLKQDGLFGEVLLHLAGEGCFNELSP